MMITPWVILYDEDFLGGEEEGFGVLINAALLCMANMRHALFVVFRRRGPMLTAQ